MSKVIRSMKNVTKGYSTVQIKVRNATSNDAWGPTGTEMSEIAQMTFNSSGEFYEIMDMLDKRLNDKGKNWRHVLKALKVLDYCLHEGSELVVTWSAKNIYIIKTLREFQYIDEEGRDVGQNVRVSAKELTSLILDEERMRNERSDRRNWKSRVTGIQEYDQDRDRDREREHRAKPPRAQEPDEDDTEYRLAIEASKVQEEEDRKKRQSKQPEPDDDDLAKAIKLSKEEEELRRRQLEEQNAASLFDDDPIQLAQPTGFNQGYGQGGAVDWSGNPIDQSMPQQPTGYTQYPQNTGFVSQSTGYPNGNQNGLAPQATGYDAFGSPQMQQQAQQQFLQPQQTSFNPYLQSQQTASPFQQQQPFQQPSQVPQMDSSMSAGSNNPWASNTLGQPASTMQPTPTGSNNPFASSIGRPTTQTATTSAIPTLSSLQEQKTASPFSTTPSYTQNTTAPFKPQSSFQAAPQSSKPVNPHEAKLNELLSAGDGMDTFGNTGNLRIPAQHTAPGTFVNSAGAGLGRIHEQQTASNPYMQTQFTGMPQTQFGNQQMPAATGPAGMNGFGGAGMQPSNNPFGPRPPQSQQHQGGGGDLIQF